MIHAEILVKGLVQGVGFRWFAVRKAHEYSLKGYVRNQGYDEVFCVVEGEEGLINDFVKELQIGPRMSRVTGVFVKKSDKIVGYDKFEIEF